MRRQFFCHMKQKAQLILCVSGSIFMIYSTKHANLRVLMAQAITKWCCLKNKCSRPLKFRGESTASRYHPNLSLKKGYLTLSFIGNKPPVLTGRSKVAAKSAREELSPFSLALHRLLFADFFIAFYAIYLIDFISFISACQLLVLCISKRLSAEIILHISIRHLLI